MLSYGCSVWRDNHETFEAMWSLQQNQEEEPLKCPLLVVIYVVDLILKESQVAADLALRFAMNCSPNALKKVHGAFGMTAEDLGDYEAFANFSLQFYLKYFDSKFEEIEEYPTLKTEEQWDAAVLVELQKFKDKESEGAFIQCSWCLLEVKKHLFVEWNNFWFGSLIDVFEGTKQSAGSKAEGFLFFSLIN